MLDVFMCVRLSLKLRAELVSAYETGSNRNRNVTYIRMGFVYGQNLTGRNNLYVTEARAAGVNNAQRSFRGAAIVAGRNFVGARALVLR